MPHLDQNRNAYLVLTVVMPPIAPVDWLADKGRGNASQPTPSLAESRDYCRRLALSHYENFAVASWLLPRGLRPHFQAVYAYCRWADDLADEADPAERSELLAWWGDELRACYRGELRHPVFVALAATIREFTIPAGPFLDLLDAFEQDQRVTRYERFDELLDYCRRSANPVGRIVLYLGRCYDERRAALSDQICTGLQLANFWQDVARDWQQRRIYLPQETCARFEVGDEPWRTHRCTSSFRAALEFEVNCAESYLRAGEPLIEQVPPFLRGDLWLFVQGGLRILTHIRAQQFDVWTRRPRVTRREQFGLLLKAFWKQRGFGRGSAR